MKKNTEWNIKPIDIDTLSRMVDNKIIRVLKEHLGDSAETIRPSLEEIEKFDEHQDAGLLYIKLVQRNIQTLQEAHFDNKSLVLTPEQRVEFALEFSPLSSKMEKVAKIIKDKTTPLKDEFLEGNFDYLIAFLKTLDDCKKITHEINLITYVWMYFLESLLVDLMCQYQSNMEHHKIYEKNVKLTPIKLELEKNGMLLEFFLMRLKMI